MRPETAQRHRESCLNQAVSEVQSGASYPMAAFKNHVPKSTLFECVHTVRARFQCSNRTNFSADEEKRILEFVLKCANKGVPLARGHVVEATTIFITTLRSERSSRLPFRNGRSGSRWVLNFHSKHRETLKHAVPFVQDAKRFAAVNAETLKTHFSTLRALFDEYSFDDRRVWNLDEAGVTPGKDTRGNTPKKRFLRRNAAYDSQARDFHILIVSP